MRDMSKVDARRVASQVVGDLNEVFSALEARCAGDPEMIAIVTQRVLRHLVDAKGERPVVAVLRATRRQAIVAMLDGGLTLAQVGDRLGIAPRRVRQIRDQETEPRRGRNG
jgi:DNA-binding NarL/FixJ family response regulator